MSDTGAAEPPTTGAAGAGVGSQLGAPTSSSVQPGVGAADIGAGAGVAAGADMGVGAQALMDNAGTGTTGAGETCSMRLKVLARDSKNESSSAGHFDGYRLFTGRKSKNS